MGDTGSDVGRPAAAIVETVQGEGGIHVARPEWLRGLAERCRENEIPLIVDDVQMGCGRRGPFFSFEVAGGTPDIVCMSKSIGGYGLPLAITLIRPDLDVWEPGEHTGTFRGIDPALITAAAALRTRRAAHERRLLAGLRTLVDTTPQAQIHAERPRHGARAALRAQRARRPRQRQGVRSLGAVGRRGPPRAAADRCGGGAAHAAARDRLPASRPCSIPPSAPNWPGERTLAFARLWTREEAYLKGLGVGVATDLAAVDPAEPRSRGWSIFDLDLGPDHAAAVALRDS